MAAVKRSPSGEAEFRRVRHLAALKAWDKRGRKKDQAGVAVAKKNPIERWFDAAGPSKPGGGDPAAAIKVTGPRGGPPEAVPLEDPERWMRLLPLNYDGAQVRAELEE